MTIKTLALPMISKDPREISWLQRMNGQGPQGAVRNIVYWLNSDSVIVVTLRKQRDFLYSRLSKSILDIQAARLLLLRP